MPTLPSCGYPVESWAALPPRTVPGEVSRAAALALAEEIRTSEVDLVDVVAAVYGPRYTRSHYTMAQKLLAGEFQSAALVSRVRVAFDRLVREHAAEASRV